MEIQYNIKGVTLNVIDLININKYYEAAYTAEYILEGDIKDLFNYPIPEYTEEEAMQIAYEVRRLMEKYDYDETEAIEEIINEREKKNND